MLDFGLQHLAQTESVGTSRSAISNFLGQETENLIFRGLINLHVHIAMLAMYVIKMVVKEVEAEMGLRIHLGNELSIVRVGFRVVEIIYVLMS